MSIVLSKRKLPAPGGVHGSGVAGRSAGSAAEGLDEAAHVRVDGTQDDHRHDRTGEALVDRGGEGVQIHGVLRGYASTTCRLYILLLLVYIVNYRKIQRMALHGHFWYTEAR